MVRWKHERITLPKVRREWWMETESHSLKELFQDLSADSKKYIEIAYLV